MKLNVLKGKTNVTVYVFIQDSSSTVGAGLTGLVFNSAGLVAHYVRPLGSATSIPLVTQTVTGAHTDGGFVEVSAANMPGVYRLDLPDAVVATGVPSVVLELKGATNMAPVPLEIQLVNYDPENGNDLGLATIVLIRDSQVVRRNTAQAVAAGTITLDAGASAEDGAYRFHRVRVVSATTGVGQIRYLTNYVGATKVGTLSSNWDITPTGTVVFEILTGIGADLATVQNIADSIVAWKKNTARANIVFPMIDSTTGDPATGKTVTAERSLDGAAFSAMANAVSEIGTTGFYKINAAASDLNADTIMIKFTATGCRTTSILVLTKT